MSQNWQNQLAELLRLTEQACVETNAMSEAEFERWLASDDAVSATIQDSREVNNRLDALGVDAIENEIRRRIATLGGSVLAIFVKRFEIRVSMAGEPFRVFKKAATTDPVLRFFRFTHRSPKKAKMTLRLRGRFKS